MQFQVPQFIDIEDKIMGPLTLRQFLYLAAAGAFSFISFFALQTVLWGALTVIMGLIAATFAFIKYNGQPMVKVVAAFTKFLWFPKFYLWRYTAPSAALPTLHALPKQNQEAPVSNNPLKMLMLKLTTSKQAIPNREKALPPNIVAANH